MPIPIVGTNIKLVADPAGPFLYACDCQDNAPGVGLNGVNRVRRSADGGGTWTTRNDGTAFDNNFRPNGFALLGTALFCWGAINGGGGATYKSTDGGSTWNATETHNASTLWKSRIGFGAAVFNSKLWLMGGFDTALQNDVWSTPDGVTWTRVTAAAGWSARNWMASCASASGLFIIGGKPTGSSYPSDCWFSADGVTWNQTGTDALLLEFERWVACEVNGALVCYSGFNQNFDGAHSGVDRLIVSADGGATFTQAFADGAVTGVQRACQGMAPLDSSLYICGGDSCASPTPGPPLEDIWGVPFTASCVFN